MPSQIEIVRQVTQQFCLDFVENPYQCYTEHGLHALVFTRLYNALPDYQRYTCWGGHQVCVLQKEYPTTDKLEKSRRQHWDIALIGTPPKSLAEKDKPSYDYLKLAAVVEVGMNEAEEHLEEDIERVCLSLDNDSVEYGFVVHLYRLSQPGALTSERDWSANSKRILSPEDANELAVGKPVEVIYAMADSTGKYKSRVWLLCGDEPEPLSTL